MNTKTRATVLLTLYILLMVTAGFAVSIYIDQETIRSYVVDKGFLSYIIFGIFEYLYVVFVPLYNTAVHLMAGYIFGGEIGWLINFIATTAGLITIIYLVKRWGRPFLEKMVSKELLDKYDNGTKVIAPMLLFLIYVLPLFPDDEFTYIIAASNKVSFGRYVLPIILGNITKSSVSFIGAEGTEGIGLALETRIILLVIGVILVGIQEWIVQRKSKSQSYSLT